MGWSNEDLAHMFGDGRAYYPESVPAWKRAVPTARTEEQAEAIRNDQNCVSDAEIADFAVISEGMFGTRRRSFYLLGHPLSSSQIDPATPITPQGEIDAYCERCKAAGVPAPMDKEISRSYDQIHAARLRVMKQTHPAWAEERTQALRTPVPPTPSPEPPAPKPQPDRAAILAHAAKLPPAKRARYLASKGVGG